VLPFPQLPMVGQNCAEKSRMWKADLNLVTKKHRVKRLHSWQSWMNRQSSWNLWSMDLLKLISCLFLAVDS
jgi:hypothetical protein